MKNCAGLEKTVQEWTPERQAEVTGISAETLRDLVRSHNEAKGAALYMATGVNQGRSGTLCFWLLEWYLFMSYALTVRFELIGKLLGYFFDLNIPTTKFFHQL